MNIDLLTKDMAKALTCVFLVFLHCGLALSAENGICSMMVRNFGYPCEEHLVKTQDGYILSMQRIPAGRSGAAAQGIKIPVLLQHGILMDGSSWLLNSPNESLGYILADNGFDVWIANARGTRFSRGHTSLSPNQADYWQWSWDELVTYEFPANVQYVHDKTGQKVQYVGHSLGTLVALASFSQNKVLDMLRSATLLSPIAYLGQIGSPVARYIVEDLIAEEDYWLGIYEFNPVGSAVSNLLKTLCKTHGLDCFDLMIAVTGNNCCLNSSTVAYFLANFPQSTATKNVVHLAQMIRQGTIARFDYGISNFQHYGQNQPPHYNMASIPKDFPLYISYGGLDILADVSDVKILLGNLGNHNQDKLTVQYQKGYAHLDFIMAVNAKQEVYDPLMTFLRSL